MFKIKNYHFCFPYLDLGTEEHLQTFAKNCEGLIDICSFYVESKNTFGLKKGKINFLNQEEFLAHSIELSEKKVKQIVFLQSPYVEHYPEWFRAQLTRRLTAYLGYYLPLVEYESGQFAGELVNNAQYLLISSKFELHKLKVYGLTKKSILTGSSILHEIRSKNVLQKNKKSEITLLWAPHWNQIRQQTTTGFSRWDQVVKPLLDFMIENKHNKLIIRPHPIMTAAMDYVLSGKTKPVANKEVQDTVKLLKENSNLISLKTLINLNNVKFTTNSLYFDVTNSDALITDGGSIIGFWAATGKPICVFHDEDSPDYNNDGLAILKQTLIVKNAKEVLDFLNNCLLKQEINQELIEISRNVHPTFESSPSRIFILSLYNNNLVIRFARKFLTRFIK